METPTRRQLEQQLATGLQDHFETQQLEAMERLCDPSRSLMAYQEQVVDSISFSIWMQDEQRFRVTGFRQSSEVSHVAQLMVNFEGASDSLFSLIKNFGGDTASDNQDGNPDLRAYGKVVGAIERYLSTPLSIESAPSYGTTISTLIHATAIAKPDVMSESSLPIKKPRGVEELGHKAFRLAANALHKLATKPLTKHQLEGQRHKQNMQRTPLLEAVVGNNLEARLAYEDYDLIIAFKRVARDMLERIMSPDMPASEIIEEFTLWNSLLLIEATDQLHQIEAHASETPPEEPDPSDLVITYQTVNRDMLRPDEGLYSDRTRALAETDTTTARRPSGERMSDDELDSWLGLIAMSWTGTNEVEIVQVELAHSGRRSYKAAILSETLPDGTVIEHAVASTGDRRDALFVFRGERGILDGYVACTWHSIFDDTKRSAKHGGARRMLHTGNIKDRIMEYLTRKAEDLDRPDYNL